MISRESAIELLEAQNPEPHMVQHALASEAVMRTLAKHFGEDENVWGVTGLLHDVDFPHTRETPEQHGVMAVDILQGHLPEEAVHAIRAHNSDWTGVHPESRFDYALRAGETVTGLVTAAALVRPTGFEGMEAKSLKKKMKDKAFAASVNRETIRECEKIDLSLDTFLSLAITALGSLPGETLLTKGKGLLSFVLALILTATAFIHPAAATVEVALHPTSIEGFSAPLPPWENTVRPSIKEQHFPLQQAVNIHDMEKRFGPLSAAQKQYLEKHRFLLLPKRQFVFEGYGESYLYDEMLFCFDQLGGAEYIAGRLPENAVFVGPDPFLHALHTYFSMRLKNIEQTEFSLALYAFLTELHANTVSLRAASSEESRAAWERLEAQIVVPLILIRNTSLPGGVLMYDPADERSLHTYLFDPEALSTFIAEEEGLPHNKKDSLENALVLFEEYSPRFSVPVAEAIKFELQRIYAATDTGASALGLSSTYGSQTDYTQFKPRGHYAGSPILRAYFRTMIYLGQLGWDLWSDNGLEDAINFAVAMSFEAPVENRSAMLQPKGAMQGGLQGEQLTTLGAWKFIMEISNFFVGSPDTASYPEWTNFLLRYSGVKSFTPDSAADKGVQERLRAKLTELTPVMRYFQRLQTPSPTKVLTVFPQRFTIPWLIADKLTHTPGTLADSGKDLPAQFSGLWVPGVFGSEYARSLVARQVALCLASELSGGDDGGSAEKTQEAEADAATTQASVEALLGEMDLLRGLLGEETENSWHSSVGALWLRLLGTLTSTYAEGYPLYMQDAAFAAKQLETFMGSYTELKHDTLLYEKPNYAEGGEGGDDEDALPVPKGFVEPNLPFWHGLLRTVGYVEAGFRKYGLYQHDLEEYGTLTRFRKDLELCAALAEKELRGQPLTEDEYESIRILTLQYMAAPLDSSNVLTEEMTQSGLIVDVQTAFLESPDKAPRIVYEATGEPMLMLVLVGNESSPRVVAGMAYSHYEFVTPHGSRLTDSIWKKRVYGKYSHGGNDIADEERGDGTLPHKNFWYDVLQP